MQTKMQQYRKQFLTVLGHNIPPKLSVNHFSCKQARKSAGERSTPDLKPVRKDTRSPKQEQSVAQQTRPWSNKNVTNKKNKKHFSCFAILLFKYAGC